MSLILLPIITEESAPLLVRVRPKKGLYTRRERHFQGLKTQKEIVTKYLTDERRIRSYKYVNIYWHFC